MQFLAGTDYEKWANYDPDAQLSMADVQEEKEDRERQRRKARKELQAFEHKVLVLTLDVASAAASRAKVERLRALKRQRRGGGGRRTQDNVPTTSTTAPIEPVDVARGKDLQTAIDCRALGLQLLNGSITSNDVQTLQHFQNSATAAEALLRRLPSLPASVRFIPVPQKQTDCGCGRGHNQPDECVVEEEDQTKEVSSPRLANIAVVGLRVLNDARVGLARCLLHSSPTDVVDHLKRVLLSDDSRADAWLLRGKAFQMMNVPLLAQLHYKRAMEEYGNVRNPYSKEIEDEEGKTKEEQEQGKGKEKDQGKKENNTNTGGMSSWNPKTLMNECRGIVLTGRKPRMERLCDLLSKVIGGTENSTNNSEMRLKRLVQEAHAIYAEGYYDTAALRYEAGARAARKMMVERLAKCQQIRKRHKAAAAVKGTNGAARVVASVAASAENEEKQTHNAFDANDGRAIMTTSVSILRELAVECHLRVANCCLKRQLGYKRANVHCTYALRLDPTNAQALCTRAKALMEDMRLVLALEDLSRANVLCEKQLLNLENANRTTTSLLISEVSALMVQTLHRCETWMENSEYISFTKSLARAKVPVHRPMSVVLLITTNKTTTGKAPMVSTTDTASASSSFFCNAATTSNDIGENFMALITGVHSSKLHSLEQNYGGSNGTKIPTLGHYLQNGVGVGTHETAFCGKWHGLESDPTVQHGFGARLWTNENDALAVAKEAALWIEKQSVVDDGGSGDEKKNNTRSSSRETPFFIVVSLDGTDGGSPDMTIDAMSRVVEAATKAAGSGDVVVVTASINGATTPLSFVTLSSSSTSCTGASSSSTSSLTSSTHASILDVVPTLLHYGGVISGKKDGLLESFCSTISGYAGFYNPLPFHGQNLFYVSIHFESKRRLLECQYIYDDDSILSNDASGIEAGTFTTSPTAASLCFAPSSLMSVLKGERKGPISFCVDPACLHPGNGGVAGIAGQVTGRKVHHEGGNVLRRYYCTAIKSNQSLTSTEIVWFGTDDVIPSTTGSGNVCGDVDRTTAPLSLHSNRMKFIVTTSNIDYVETFELYNATQEWNEGGEGVDGVDLSKHSKYRYLMEIGLRLLHESRDRCTNK